MATAKRKEVRCVVAIDLGTTFSGYAYSTVDDYKNDKLNIKTNQAWNSGNNSLLSYKTATSLVLTKEGDFKSFGYEADRFYENELLDDKQNADDYLYFRRFKMELHTTKPTCSLLIRDVNGREYSALSVFSLSIKTLKEHCLEYFNDKVYRFDEDEIKWTLTVPAIWSDEAKMFMRRAAVEAGIPNHRLIVAREPEAAALYCQYWYTKNVKRNIFENGTQYLVVDIGGGTVDICGHEILRKGRIREICKAEGCDCGGISVDKEFSNIFLDILGSEAMETFEQKYVTDYLQLMSDFECIKRTISSNPDPVNIRIPLTCLDQLNQLVSFKTLLQRSKYADKIDIKGETMIIYPEVGKSLFLNTIEKIKYTIERVPQNALSPRKISLILVVGGLSESKLVRTSIAAAFPDKKVIIPDDPTLAVLRGAVLYGHKPDVVTTRVTQHSYGRKIKPIFNPKRHDKIRTVNVDGKTRCDGVFEELIKANTPVPVGKQIRKKYHTISRDQEYIRICLYKSVNEKTKYIDDEGCSLVGECLVPVLSPSDLHREVSVQFEFGDTEISITATDQNTKNKFVDTFHLE